MTKETVERPEATSESGEESVVARAAALFRQDLSAFSYTQLREAIESIVPLVDEPLELNGLEVRWHKVADPDQLLTEAVSDSRWSPTDIDPFWSVAWRAAQGIDSYLARMNLSGVRVLELGGGAGYAGLAAAARGASVTLTDAVELALLVARLNSLPLLDRVVLARLRWGETRLAVDNFPIIIGSDLVYDPNHFSILQHCAREHLAPGGRWILSEPNRHTGDAFAQWIVAAGWKCRIEQMDLADGRIPIRIFECHLL